MKATGGKGRCVQNSRKCYCKKITSGKKKRLLNFGLGVGEGLLFRKRHKKHHKKGDKYYSD